MVVAVAVHYRDAPGAGVAGAPFRDIGDYGVEHAGAPVIAV